MSTTIDERVVEMRFDNQHFENNVSTTMSTLDKLKAKLNFTGASKGLESVNTAARNVNMTGLGSAVETVTAKFSALQVMGVTALANITNSAVNAGKRIVKSLTIDPIKSGFEEYETKMGSIQTILANTEHQGTTLDDVTAALEKLNLYADKTIYNFQQMTKNIGTFTAAGVDLETSVRSIQGIANLAAVSGSTSQQASTAMYQLSQALASGTVKLMDWNSVVNAGMGGKVFQNALIRTAAALDKSSDDVDAWKKKHIDAFGSFRDSLTSSGWLTTEVLTKTLEQFTMAAEEGSDEWNEFKKSLMADGYTEKQAEEILKMANTATDAATKVKTFTQLMDTLKESAQSGWAQTWELIVGDFEEAKEFFTGLSNIFGDIIGKSAERRNGLLSGALDSNWDKLIKKISDAGIETEKFEDSIRKIVGDDKLDGLIDEFGSLEKAVKSGAISSDILKKAIEGIFEVSKYDFSDITRNLSYGFVGKDVEKVQKALKDLGYKLAEGVGYDGIWGPLTESAVREFQKANGLIVDGIVGPETLAALEKAGGKIEATAEDVEGLKVSCADLIDVITSTSGRELLLDSLMNIIKAIQRPLSAVGEAFREIFSLSPDQLYNALAKINNFTKKLVPKGILDTDSWDTLTQRISKLGVDTPKFLGKLEETLKKHGVNVDDLKKKYGGLAKAFEDGAISMDIVKEALLSIDGITESLLIGGETVDKVRRTFKGLFAVFDIIATIVSGPVKIAFNVVTKFLEKLGLSVLDITAKIGDSIVAFRDKLDGVIDTVTDFIVDNVGEWIKGLKETEFFKTVVGWFEDGSEAISKAVQAISDKIKELDGTKIMGYLSTLGSFISKAAASLKDSKVVGFIVDTVCGAFERLKNFFSGFKFPEFNLDNARIFAGLASALEGAGGLGGSLVNLVKWLKDRIVLKAKTVLENLFGIKWDMIKASAMDKFVTFWQTTGDKIKKAFAKVGEVFKAIAEFMFGTEEVNLPAILDVAEKLLWLGVLIEALGFLETLSSPLENVTDAIDNLTAKLKWQAVGAAFQSMALALGTLTLCIIILANMPDMKKALAAAGMLAGLLVLMGIIIAGLTFLSVKLKSKDALDVVGIALSLMLLIGAIFLLTQTIKQIDDMTLKDPLGTFLALAGMLLALSAGIKIVAAAGSSSFKSVAAVLTLVAALKMVLDVITAYDEYDWSGKSDAIARMVGMLIALSVAINIASRGLKNNAGAGGLALLLLAMVFSLKIILDVIDDFAKIPKDDLIKGGAVIVALMATMTACMAAISAVNKGQVLDKGQKSVNNFVGLATALLAVVAAIWLLGKMPMDVLIQGGIAVTAVLLLFTGMLYALGKSCANIKFWGVISLLLGIGLIIVELTAVMHMMKGIPWQSSLSSAVALSGLLLALAGVFKVLSKLTMNPGALFKWSIVMAAFGAVVGLLAHLLKVLRDVNPATSIGNAVALSGLLLAMAGCLDILSKPKWQTNSIWKWVGAMAALGVLIAGLAFVLYKIREIDPKTSIANAISLGILMAALSISLSVVGTMGRFSSKGIAPMYAMVGVLALVAVIVGALDAMDLSMSIETAASLSILLLALAGVTAILTPIGAGAVGALAGAGALVGVVAIIGAFMLALAGLNHLFPKLQEWLDTGIDILEKIGVGIGKFIGGFLGGIGEGMMDSFLNMVNTFGEIVDVLAEVSEVGTGIKADGFDTIKDIIEILGTIGSTTMGSTFSDIFTSGGTSMERFQSDSIALFKTMGAIAEAASGISVNEESMNAVISVAQKLADLQGSLEPIGGVVSWFAGRDDLETFGFNVAAFISAMKIALSNLNGFQFDHQTLDEIVSAAKSLSGLQSSLEPIGGVIAWFKGRDDLETFGYNVYNFIISMQHALSGLGGFQFDHQTLDEIIAAAKSLAGLQGSLEPIGGVISWFTGRDDLETFGVNVFSFISAMKKALSALEGTTLDEAALTSVINAASKLADLQSKLEPMGNVITWFTGRTDLGTFGINVGMFAKAMGALKENMGEDGVTEAVVTSISNAGNAIIELQKALPEESWFDGKMNLSEFSGYVTEFGMAMGTFASVTSEIDATAVSTAINTAFRIKSLIESLVGLDTSGLAAFTGIGTGGFGADGAAYKIAKSISAYSNEVAGIDTSAVSTSVSAAVKLKGLIAGLVGLDTSGIANFKIGTIGTAMKSYSDKVSAIDTGAVSQSVTAATRLRSLITSLVGLDTSGVGSFKAAVHELSTVNVSDLVKAFSGASSKMMSAGADIIDGLINGMRSRISALRGIVDTILETLNTIILSRAPIFERSGAMLMTKLASGLTSKRPAVKSAMTTCIASAVSDIRIYYTSFYSAGSYLVDGFAAGISANTFKAAATAAAMANAAEAAARAALGINSPSKVFKEIGMGIPEGFILGVEKLGGSVDKTILQMTDGAIYSVGSTITKLASIISTDIDSQPTIRPVLDLTDVRAGASSIGNLFDTKSQVGVMANINSIGGMMSRYGQNGSNGEVVAAIDKLRKELGNVGNTTYSINGVTYDDGSNVATAVREIVRAARTERRV